MALISIDPFAFIAQLKRDTKMFQWVSLLFQMALSSLVTFNFTCGSALIAGSRLGVSVGSGLVAVAVVLCVFFGSSDLTRGMMLVRPAKEAEVEINSDMATTKRS